jgi:hypothetical protein
MNDMTVAQPINGSRGATVAGPRNIPLEAQESVCRRIWPHVRHRFRPDRLHQVRRSVWRDRPDDQLA